LKISKVAFLTTGWFFHENCRFFDVSDVTGTGNSLILIVSLKERTDGSLILTSSIMFLREEDGAAFFFIGEIKN